MRIHITSINGRTVYQTIMAFESPRFTIAALFRALPSIVTRLNTIEDIERLLNEMVQEGILRKHSHNTYERI